MKKKHKNPDVMTACYIEVDTKGKLIRGDVTYTKTPLELSMLLGILLEECYNTLYPVVDAENPKEEIRKSFYDLVDLAVQQGEKTQNFVKTLKDISFDVEGGDGEKLKCVAIDLNKGVPEGLPPEIQHIINAVTQGLAKKEDMN